MMKLQRLVLILTLLNLGLFVFLIAETHKTEAQAVPGVLRGRALEIVDDRGRVRASIEVLPADPNVKMPDGTRGYPETVLLRLIDSHGGPHTKLSTTEDGAGMSLGGTADPAYVQILARGESPFIKVSSKEGTQVIRGTR